MDEKTLISKIATRAIDLDLRHDFSSHFDTMLPSPANAKEIATTENELSLHLPDLLKKLLTEIANGGFGPGYGLLGTSCGHSDSDDRALLELRDFLRSTAESSGNQWEPSFLPICEWGSSVWSCIDCGTSDSRMYTLDETGFTKTRHTLHTWLEGWCNGVRHWDSMFEFEEIEIINPFTKEATLTRKRLRAI